jgi:hypothetical protein
MVCAAVISISHASHQTGWTGLVARIIQLNGSLLEELFVEGDADRLAARLSQILSVSDGGA